MKNKKKKTVVRIFFAYLILTTGLWMFFLSYSNSYNKLSIEKISPASITLTENQAEMKILKSSFIFNIEDLLPESKLYYVIYMFSPDEVRLITFLGSMTDRC